MVDPSTQSVDSRVSTSSNVSREKVRLRFRKGGDLRFLGHHDLLRCFERMMRRAEIPFSHTQGFNPRPKMNFALSLPLGVIGCEEVLELEVEPGTFAQLSPEVLSQRLADHAPPGLEILSVREIPFRVKAQIESLTYRLRLLNPVPKLDQRINDFLSQEEVWITRTTPQKGRKKEKTTRINIRPFVLDVRQTTEGLEMQLQLTPTGTVRPIELLNLLGVKEQYDAGATLERSRLQLTDERPEL